jgi:hypothetical protein
LRIGFDAVGDGLLDAGHFALETYAAEIAALIRIFLGRKNPCGKPRRDGLGGLFVTASERMRRSAALQDD